MILEGGPRQGLYELMLRDQCNTRLYSRRQELQESRLRGYCNTRLYSRVHTRRRELLLYWGFLLRERTGHIARSILADSDGNAVGKTEIHETTTDSHSSLDLHLGQTVLPDRDVGSDTILAVVHEDDPRSPLVAGSHLDIRGGNSHSIRVHGLANVEVVVLEVGNNLLGKSLSALLKRSDLFIGSVLRLQRLLHLLHVCYNPESGHSQ